MNLTTIVEALKEIARKDEDGYLCWCPHQTLFRVHDAACLTLKSELNQTKPPVAQTQLAFVPTEEKDLEF